MCAICNPKPVPEAPAKAPVRRPSTASTRPSSRTSRPPGRAVSSTPPPSVLDQRAFHVTSIRNLGSILADGALLADAEPEFPLSPAQQRAEREDVLVDGARSRNLDNYVPFFLSPDATVWQSVREGIRHPRVSSDALSAGPSDYIMLATTLRALRGESLESVLADGNPASDRTRFAATNDEADRMLGRLRAADNDLADAELLIPERVPLGVFSLVGVQNDKVRERVRELLVGSTFSPKISVYPPWFQPAER